MESFPFFFHIRGESDEYGRDLGRGIVYRADKLGGDNMYVCTGTRQIGETPSGQPIWVMDDSYTDIMPRESMFTIFTLYAVEDPSIIMNGMNAPDMDFYVDDTFTSFVFVNKPRASRPKSKSRSRKY